MPNTYSSLEVRRVLIGTVLLVGLTVVLYFGAMFAVLFDAARATALREDRSYPEVLDFFLDKLMWWALLPLAVGPLLWLATLIDVVRHQSTTQARIIWIALLIVGHCVVGVVYWLIEIRRIVTRFSATAP